jgi:predicted ATP-grasp superfamily ATP-dependent carboligase
MLRCAVADFKAEGHEVTILLDARLAKFDPPSGANYTQQILYPDEPQKFIYNATKRNDVISIIAPETNHTLQKYVKLAEETGRILLNSKSDVIANVADKAHLYKHFQEQDFPTPKTIILNTSTRIKEMEQVLQQELVYPVVFKPVDGAGCSGIRIINDADEIKDGLVEVKSESSSSLFIAQEFVKGKPISVSVLSNGHKAVALSLNSQQINFADSCQSSKYEGGVTPINHPKKAEVYSLAERVVESFPGLQGYVGVDIVIGENEFFVVDINARFTTSYVGLRQVANFNIAQALIDAVTLRKLPENIKLLGVTCFSKVQMPSPSMEGYRRSLKLAGVVSPPFPSKDGQVATSLVMGYGDNFIDAEVRVEEAKKSLSSIIS